MPKKSVKAQPWHPLLGETFAAYGLFRLYVDMGEERSLVKVCEETHRKYQLVASLSAKYKWLSRAAAHDAYIMSVQEASVEKTLQKEAITYAKRRSIYREREFTVAAKALARAEEMLSWPLAETTVMKMENINGQEVATYQVIKPAKWNQNTGAMLLKAAAEIMRLNLEMDTSRVNVNVNMQDPLVRLQHAKASYEKLVANVDQLVDEQVMAEPNQDRDMVKQQILQMLHGWVANDWQLLPEQVLLLTEGSSSNWDEGEIMPLDENDLPTYG